MLTPHDAETVCKELLPVQNKSYELGLELKLPPSDVASIMHSAYLKQQERLIRIATEFTEHKEPRPTWRAIVDALRSSSVNNPQLAEEIERKYCVPSPPETGKLMSYGSFMYGAEFECL